MTRLKGGEGVYFPGPSLGSWVSESEATPCWGLQVGSKPCEREARRPTKRKAPVPVTLRAEVAPRPTVLLDLPSCEPVIQREGCGGGSE